MSNISKAHFFLSTKHLKIPYKRERRNISVLKLLNSENL